MIYGNCIKRVLDFSAALIVLAVLLVPFLALAALLAAANRGTPFFPPDAARPPRQVVPHRQIQDDDG
ncbi:hypothetical protein J5W79_08255 [Akkermansia massiliensis]|nr:hypothetical protein [Akkermansia massiliensis]QWP72354.1 hypothetical protein J5W79_08255 [Akkermansia massiliensis]